MSLAQPIPNKFLRYTAVLLVIITICAASFYFYLKATYPDYSGHYQADCQAPSCSFELDWITSNEYWLNYVGKRTKMLRFINPSNQTFLLNIGGIDGTKFGVGSIRFHAPELDQGHVQWQGRTYKKQ